MLPAHNITSNSGKGSKALTTDDERIINNLLESKTLGGEFKDLYVYGNLARFEEDQSRADLRLVHLLSNWCGFDTNRLDRLFRSSKLMRAKWDQKHRYDGATYGQMTIEKALSNRHIHHKSEIEGYLNYHYEFRYNVVLDRIELRSKGNQEWILLADREFNSLHRRIKNDGGTIGADALKSLLESDFSTDYNPFVAYFDGLPSPDQTKAIEELASTVSAKDQEYWSNSLKKWLVATVAGAIDEDKVNHTTLIMMGAQGLGKTSWFMKLLPESLKSYSYSGPIDPKDKDTMVNISECLLVNLDELETLGRASESAIKEIITKSDIRIRRPYGRYANKLVRRASFVGSINEDQILTDTTGSRRFLIHEIEHIEYAHRVDIDKV